MRAFFFIFFGNALLGLFILAARLMGTSGSSSFVLAAQVFIPVWLVLALANMGYGVQGAGSPVMKEFPIFLLLFAVPAGIAAFIWWKFS